MAVRKEGKATLPNRDIVPTIPLIVFVIFIGAEVVSFCAKYQTAAAVRFAGLS
jgi:hypothetical protein